MKKNKRNLVQGWLKKGKRDFLTAQRELETDNPFTDIIGYHAQQAAEKYLKGYLVWEDIKFPRTHSIEDLVALASEVDSDFLQLTDKSSSLTPYAVEVRYPEFEEPLLEDAREAVEISSKIKEFITEKLPEEITE